MLSGEYRCLCGLSLSSFSRSLRETLIVDVAELGRREFREFQHNPLTGHGRESVCSPRNRRFSEAVERKPFNSHACMFVLARVA